MHSKKTILFFLLTNIAINTTSPVCEVIDCGSAEKENWMGTRGYNNSHLIEDRHTMLPENGYFAVFDGHGKNKIGHEAAEYAAKHLYEIIQTTKDKETCSIEDLFKQAFIQIDNEIMKETEAGTTAVVAIVDAEEGFLHVANVGDSRALIMKTDDSISQLSVDHKATSESERIRNVGGLIIGKRAGGVVAVSRALGDKCVKWATEKNEEEKTEENYMVSPIPYTKSINLENVAFLVLVSDGINDVMTNQEVMYFVEKQLKKKKAQEAAQALVNEAAELKSGDDLTAIVIVFQETSSSSSASSSSSSSSSLKNRTASALWKTHKQPRA